MLESAIEHARRVGDRQMEVTQVASTVTAMVALGRWDEAVLRLAEVRGAEDTTHVATVAVELVSVTPVLVHRGALAEARDLLRLLPDGPLSEDVQVRAVSLAAEAPVLRAEGRPDEALSSALGAWALREELGLSPDVKEGLTLGIDLCLETGDLERAESLLGEIEALRPGELSPSLQASGARFGARVAAARGDTDGPEAGFRAAARIFREASMRFCLAVTLLEHAEWVQGRGRDVEAQSLLAEAGTIFGELGAVPWLVRLVGVQGEDAVADRSSSGIAP
jgi:ATP/maltotriose-dependent transcriptional regulator MalT